MGKLNQQKRKLKKQRKKLKHRNKRKVDSSSNKLSNLSQETHKFSGSKFNLINDFLLTRTEKRFREKGLRGFVLEKNDNDPLYPFAYSNDKVLSEFFVLMCELRNDLCEITNLEPEFLENSQYDLVRFKLYAITVGCIIQAVDYKFRKFIEAESGWQNTLSDSQLRKFRNHGGNSFERIKVIFQTMNLVFDLGVEIDIHGEGRKSFQRTLRIREQLVHPSKMESMLLSAEKIEPFMEGWNWFSQYLIKLLRAYADKKDLLSIEPHRKSFGFYFDDEFPSESTIQTPQRNASDERERRKNALFSSLGAPEVFKKTLGRISLLSWFCSDCFYLKSNYFPFRARALTFSSFMYLESVLFSFREILNVLGENHHDIVLQTSSKYFQNT